MTEIEYKNLLAIDTSSHRLVLALAYEGDRLVKSDNSVERSHGILLMKMIDELFQSSGTTPDALDALVICLGPGSFTGLRIGLAAVKGMATALEIPVVGVNLFELFAFKRRESDDVVHLLIPSRKGEWYLGTFGRGDEAEANISIVTQVELAERVGNDPVWGVGFDPRELLDDGFGATQTDIFEYSGADLVHCGLGKLLNGETADLANLEPMYLQKAIAEVRFDRRNKQ